MSPVFEAILRNPSHPLVASCAVLLACFASCSSHATPPLPAQPDGEQVVGLQYRQDAPVTFSISAVSFEVAQDLKGRLSIKMIHGQGGAMSKFSVNLNQVEAVEAWNGPGTALWIDDKRILVDQGVLKLGEQACGAVKAGDKVRIETKGLFVNDSRRADV